MTIAAVNPPIFSDARGRGVLVFDGAMGTEIYRHHVFTNRSFDELCLSEPKLIEADPSRVLRGRGRRADDQHLRGQPRGAWPSSAWATRLREINRAGAALARRWPTPPAGRCWWPARSDRLPVQPRYEALVEEMIVEQVEGLREGGADFIIFETQPTRAALERRAAAMRRLAGVPYVLSFAIVAPVRVGRGRAGRAHARPACPPTARRRWPGASTAAAGRMAC